MTPETPLSLLTISEKQFLKFVNNIVYLLYMAIEWHHVHIRIYRQAHDRKFEQVIQTYCILCSLVALLHLTATYLQGRGAAPFQAPLPLVGVFVVPLHLPVADSVPMPILAQYPHPLPPLLPAEQLAEPGSLPGLHCARRKRNFTPEHESLAHSNIRSPHLCCCSVLPAASNFSSLSASVRESSWVGWGGVGGGERESIPVSEPLQEMV